MKGIYRLMRRIISGIMALITAVILPLNVNANPVEQNKVATSALYGSRINMSLDQKSVKFSPHYFDPNDLYLTSSSMSVMTIPGLSDEQMESVRKIISGLQDLNLSEAMMAGILGNLRQESGFDPSALSDSKTFYGLVQWGRERRRALETIPDYDTVEGQVKFLKAELQGTAPATGNFGADLDRYLKQYDNSDMHTVDDVEMACEAFCVIVEGCTGGKVIDANRAKNGQYYQDLGQRKSYALIIYKYLQARGATSETAAEFISIAETKLGAPYVWGASGPNSFDCSGFVYWVLNQAGISIDRKTTADWVSGDPRFQKVTNYDELQAGDLFLIRYKDGGGHIGIVGAEGTVYHASGGKAKSSWKWVKHDQLGEWWRSHFTCGWRYIGDGTTKTTDTDDTTESTD